MATSSRSTTRFCFTTQLVLSFLLLLSTAYCGRFDGLKVIGNQLVNSRNETVRLIGVNRSGAEFMCLRNSTTTQIWDGPSDEASIRAMLRFSDKINAIRIPMNSICWLGINGVPTVNGGKNYQREIKRFVDMLTDVFDMAVILDLQWNAPGNETADKQRPMPDVDHVPEFWTQVANEYKGYSNVIFDVFNEPFPCFSLDLQPSWKCWKAGGNACYWCLDVTYPSIGIDDLVNVIRKTGAMNILMLAGPQRAGSLNYWLDYYPKNHTNIVASWHSYNFNVCMREQCWEKYVLPVAAKVPIITGEIGEDDCAHGYIDRLMPWLTTHNISFLAWTWNTWDCRQGPSIIQDYDGTPTNYGAGIKDYLRRMNSIAV